MPTSYSWPLSSPSAGSPPPAPSADAYARQLRALLPSGALWLLDPDSEISKTLLALAAELSRVDGRGQDLLTEADPRTATEMLSDWEQALGLPDEMVTEIPATDAARRVAITQKLVRIGGQTPAYFVDLSAACGYTVTISEWADHPVLRSGFRCGARCYGADWAFVWTVNVSSSSSDALTHSQFEAVIRAAAPAHTVVVFSYPP